MSEQHTRIDITWGAARNAREGYGWVPAVTVDGHTITSTWSSSGWDRDVAHAMAHEMAQDEANRYVGDWDIRVTEVNAEPKPKPTPTQSKPTMMRKATTRRIRSPKAPKPPKAPRVNIRATLASLRARHKHELIQLRSAHQLEALALKDRHRSERETLKARHKRELASAQTATSLLSRAKRKAA